MLGKGLESLIPPANGGDDPGKTGGQAPPASPAQPAPVSAAAPPVGPSEPKRVPSAPKQYEAIFHIEVDKIKPNPQQPRRLFDEAGLNELAASIREFGILQPLVVTKVEREVPTGTEVEYYLIAGERRLLAAKKLGWERVPAIIRVADLDRERLELAVIENIQREDLNPVETARAFARLQDEFRLTQREIASRLGKSREVVANTMRLLDLPPFIQAAIEKNQISESHGRLLLTIDDPGLQERLFNDLVNNQMTTRELRNRVRGTRPQVEEKIAEPELSPELKMLQEKLSTELGAPVKIQQHGNPPAVGGKITISFYSEEELKNIMERLGGGEADAI